MNATGAEDIARALGRGSEKREGAGWTTFCPIHEAGGEHSPSLSVVDKDDKVLWYCRSAGCTQADITSALKALGLLNGSGNGQRRPVPAGKAGSRQELEDLAVPRQELQNLLSRGAGSRDELVVELQRHIRPELATEAYRERERHTAQNPREVSMRTTVEIGCRELVDKAINSIVKTGGAAWVEINGIPKLQLTREETRNGNGEGQSSWRAEDPNGKGIWGPVTRYVFLDPDDGRELATHCRIDKPDGKAMWWERDGKRGLGGLKPSSLPLYGCEALKNFPDGTTVVHTEGEKARDALDRAGIAAVGTATGAGGTHDDAALRPLVRFRNILWPDRDEGGRAHMQRHAARLRSLGAKELAVVDWPGAPEGGDAADFESDDAALLALVNAARPFEMAEESAADEAVPALGVLASEIEVKPIDWLRAPYFAKGKLHEVVGDAGLGKSLFTIDLIARITLGRGFPDPRQSSDVGVVAILSAEDDAADTLVPRLIAAGANLDRVRIVEPAMGDLPLTLPDHLSLLEETIRRYEVVAIFIDPLSAFLSDKIDSHNDSSARRVLFALSELAKRTHCAIIVIRHLNKNSSVERAQYRSSGSIAFTAATRASYLVGLDPRDKSPDPRRIFACIKINFAAKPPALMFCPAPSQENPDVPVLEWIDESCPLSADDLLRSRKMRNADALSEAVEFLKDELRDGAKPSAEIDKRARELDIADSTLKRARTKAGVKAFKKEFDGDWFVTLNKDEVNN
jgi:putative DNA primase/helicase